MAGDAGDSRRYLCSQLVTLSWKDGSRVVILEEIWRSGAVLDSEQAVPEGVAVEIWTGTVRLYGTITGVRENELGWRIEVEFSPTVVWSRESFEPGHLFDPASVKAGEKQ